MALLSRAARGGYPTERNASWTRAQMAGRGMPRFSGPNATSRPTRPATEASAGSCTSRPTAAPAGGAPSTSTEPVRSPDSVVVSTPARARSSVDLPEPLGPASSTRSPGSSVRDRSARTGSRRPNGRQVSRSTSTREPAATGVPRRSGEMVLTDFLTGRERVERAGAGQGPDQRPAAEAGHQRAGDDPEQQVEDLPGRRVVRHVGPPLVADDLQHGRERAAQGRDDRAEPAPADGGEQHGHAPLVAEEQLDVGGDELGEQRGAGATHDEAADDRRHEPDAEREL